MKSTQNPGPSTVTAPEIPAPIPITCQADLVAALRARRAELRLTCLHLDHKAGFHDGYTSHLEHPERKTGRNSLKLNPMAIAWIEALGFNLVLISKT